ncbi:MAG: hypothetical protein IJQ61_11095 [Bacteroidales bacterium]|nr:hypothetical protein [Bacteroidales bacterium]
MTDPKNTFDQEAILNTHKTIAALKLKLEQYKKMEADVEAVKERQMDLNRLYASAEQDKAELQRDWNLS